MQAHLKSDSSTGKPKHQINHLQFFKVLFDTSFSNVGCKLARVDMVFLPLSSS